MACKQNKSFSMSHDSEMIKKKIFEMGAHEVGIGDVSTGMPSEFSHMPRAIAMAIHHPPLPLQERPVYPYAHVSRAIERRLLEIQRIITAELRREGWRALAIPPDSYRLDSRFISRLFKLFPHKTAATCAGLGWVGKSGLLISKRFGPLLCWATILTNAPLQVNDAPIKESYCGKCRCCVDACPAGAIIDENWQCVNEYRTIIDVKRCAAELQKNKELYGMYACGICMLVCPLGQKKKTYAQKNRQ